MFDIIRDISIIQETVMIDVCSQLHRQHIHADNVLTSDEPCRLHSQYVLGSVKCRKTLTIEGESHETIEV